MFIMPNEAWSAILGAAVGSLITYRFAVTLADRQFQHLKAISKMDAWHIAAGEFIAALSPDIRMLEDRHAAVGNLMDFMRRVYLEHQMRAIAKFEHFVLADKRGAFKTEWQRYCYGQHSDGRTQSPDDEGLPNEELLFLYCESHLPPPGARSATAYVVERMHALLAFAKDA